MNIRKIAQLNYSTERVKYLYQAYFEQLDNMKELGWNDISKHDGVSKYKRFEKTYN